MGKRARMLRSSSLGDGSALDHLIRPPPSAMRWPPRPDLDPAATSTLGTRNWAAKPTPTAVEPVKPRPAQAAEPRRQSILSLGSPCRDAWDAPTPVDEGFGGFFRECFACKKPITDHDPIFMYGVLLAFCSSGCRNKQIKLDEEAERVAIRANAANAASISRKLDGMKSPWDSHY